MKAIAVVVFIVQALALQGTTAQYIRTAPVVGPYDCGCGTALTSPVVATGPTTVVQVPSVANTLADTLSLLTVSSLLAETLPLSPAIVAGVPMGTCGCNGAWNGPLATAWNAPLTASWGGCGCGCGGGCGCGYGYGLGYNVLL